MRRARERSRAARAETAPETGSGVVMGVVFVCSLPRLYKPYSYALCARKP